MSVSVSAAMELTVATLNCMLLPLPPTNRKRRTRAALRWLHSHTRNVDVLVLTEVFSDHSAATLRTGLSTVWPHMSRPLLGRSTTVANGGVLIASKWPMTDGWAITFPHTVGSDKLAAKGAAAVVVCKPGGTPVVVVGTHLQAGTDGAAVSTRWNQWLYLQWFMQRFLRGDARDLPRIVVGDFNEDLVDHEHQICTKIGLHPVLPPPQDGMSFDLADNELAAARAEPDDVTAMLDGVLVDVTDRKHRCHAASRLVYPRDAAGKPFTDHEMVVAVLRWVPRAQAKTPSGAALPALPAQQTPRAGEDPPPR